jgi:hypothetical protein
VNLAGTSVFNITDTRSTTTGLTYDADYSAGFTDRTLVDKAYVDSNTKTYSAGNYIDVSSGGAISFDPSEATNTSAQVVPSNADVLFEINNGLWQNFMDASWFNTVNYANASMQPTDNTKINVSGYTRTMYKWNGANCNCSNSVHLNDYATSSRESGNNSRRLYYINNLSAGDTLEIFRGTTASPSTKIYEFNASNIGGMVMLVYNENNVWEAHELSNPSATGGGASLGAAVNGGMAVNADSMELDRDNFLDDVPLEVLGSDDELLVYDSDATGKKFRRVQLDKIHSGKRIGVVSTPASGGVQTGITPAYPSFVNSNIFVVKGNNGGDGNVNVDLGPGTQDGLTVREVIVVLEDFNPDETVTIQDDGVVKKVFDRNVSFVMCVFDGTDWKLYPAANPEHIGNSGESGGGYKSYTGLTWNTTAPGNIGIFYSTYLQPEAGVSHYFVMKDPAPGTQHYVEIDDSDTWNNGDIVRIFSTGNANATKFGFWFDGYSASNIKNIDGNTTTTIAQGNGDPTLELNPDNASWLEIVHYGGQWYLMGTDE